MTRWFEDVEIGEVVELGVHTFLASEARAFAQSYEPHLARLPESPVSGWLIALTGHRKMLDSFFAETDRMREKGETIGEAGPAPGLDYAAFPNPLPVGGTVRFIQTITGKRTTRSRPDWGLLSNRIEGFDDAGKCVYRTEFVGFRRCRLFA